ncbi:MAG TPA: hypothetical protein VJ386_03550, partial [Candidatus Deferrimicrobiaceae bacterium]|nr:hypothetical protein [Candidatus Deferrimicrobiaceae bacterium]
AQVLLRAGDPRFPDLVRTTADLASSTGQWPEAVHVRTKGGCMGDGHHVWASAEWVLMVRNGFLREEGDRLILGSGVFPAWLDQPEALTFGPAPSDFGEASVRILPRDGAAEVQWSGNWRSDPSRVEVRLPGFEPVEAEVGKQSVFLSRRRSTP